MHFYQKVQGQIIWPCVSKKVQGQITWPCVEKRGQGQINWPCAALCCPVLHCVVHAKSQPCWLHCAASRGGWQEPGSAEARPGLRTPRAARVVAWAKSRPGYKPGRCPGPPASPRAPGPGRTRLVQPGHQATTWRSFDRQVDAGGLSHLPGNQKIARWWRCGRAVMCRLFIAGT